MDALLQMLYLVELVFLGLASALAVAMAATLLGVWMLSAVRGAPKEELRQGG